MVSVSAPTSQSSTSVNTTTAIPSVEGIAELLGEERYRKSYIRGTVSIHVITVLAQTRQTFERIPELGTDLARNKQLNNLILGVFAPEEFGQYLEVTNLIRGTDYSLEEFDDSRIPLSSLPAAVRSRVSRFSPSTRYVYLPLIAGERRLKGFQYDWEDGCLNCQEKYGSEEPGKCFFRHFRSDRIEVKFCVNISPLAALFLQLSENTHMPVPSHEEALTYYTLFQLIRTADPKYPVTKFARDVGRNASVLRTYLGFCELPEELQETVRCDSIRFGVALEIGRIIQEDDDEESNNWRVWLEKAMLQPIRVEDFRALVNEYIRVKRSGQTSLFEIMDENAQEQLASQNRRLVVAREIVQGIHAILDYFGRVGALFEDGRLGKEDSPFSKRSPVRLFRKLVEKQKQLLPFMRSCLPQKEADEIEAHLDGLCEVVKQLESVASEEAEAAS